MTEQHVDQPKLVSHDEWLAARKKLLVKEKVFSAQRDEISAARREMPWEHVDTPYVFDAPEGKRTLAQLFGDKSQLVIYHFMLAPGQAQGCTGCSFIADHIDGATVHLAQRDVAFAAVSRATQPEIEAFKKRMGWRFPWFSSHDSSFNYDFHVSFTPEQLAAGAVEYNYEPSSYAGAEAPGLSVFFRDAAGDIFHTYSTYARGLDMLIGAYNYLDLVPKGRDEVGPARGMAWVRHHDRY